MDFDADGTNDLISGSYPGELYLFKGQGGGKFAKSEQIKHADGKPVKVGLAAVVYAHDWDADGDLDLLVGDIEGQVHLIANDGTKRKSANGRPQLLKAGGQPIKVSHGDAGPSVADWDGDGKADLIVGNGAGGVTWYRNTGDAKTPQLAAAQVLVPDVLGNGPQALAGQRGTRAKVHATDWNGDGMLDLLVGDFHYQDAAPPAVDEAAQVERKADNAAWLKQYTALQKTSPGETDEARRARMKQMAALVAEFKETKAAAAKAQEAAASNYHGYVWVFLRKDGGAQ